MVGILFEAVAIGVGIAEAACLRITGKIGAMLADPRSCAALNFGS
jgi:hypothetical protein